MIPTGEKLAISIRAYAVRAGKPKRQRRFRVTPRVGPSDLALIFDCETEVVASQQLRVGAYQLRKGVSLREAGLFFDPVPPEEVPRSLRDAVPERT